MAQKSGFFNSLSAAQIDRKYNAEDYCDNLAVVISNGVLRSAGDDLKVTSDGMTVSVATGRAWINGHWFKNDEVHTFAPVQAVTGGSRYDRVMLRLDNTISKRDIYFVYVQGEASYAPEKPKPIREGEIYDLVLADIHVAANATGVTVTDQRANPILCGWVYSVSGDNSFIATLDHSFNEWFENARNTLSSVTLFKRYTWKNCLESNTDTVQFDIQQYNPGTCFIEVIVNGMVENNYALDGNIITFDGVLIGGTDITVNCFKSIDGMGIMSVADEITELQNAVAAINGDSEFTYFCTGLDDNISLSQIAQALYTGSYVESDLTPSARNFLDGLGGTAYLATLTDESQITVDVVGKCGVGAAFSGNGEITNRYKYFSLGSISTSNKRIIFDFAKCDKITVECAADTSNIIIYGTDLYTKNINIEARRISTGTDIEMIAGANNKGSVNVDNSRLKVYSSGIATIAKNGNFTNCYCLVSSTAENAYCFDCTTNSYIRLNGGTYLAYSYGNAHKSAPMNIDSGVSGGVITAFNISCPVIRYGELRQHAFAYGNAGKIYINGIVSTLAAQGECVSVVGQIAANKR